MDQQHIDKLKSLRACSEAVAWFEQQPNITTAWNTCARGDWMLWLLGNFNCEPDSNSRRKLVLCACQCARLALKHIKAGEDRPRIAIETAEQWARREGGVTLDVVKSARAAARAAADAAAYAAAVAAADAARSKTLATCSDIVREAYPRPPVAR